MVGSQIDKNEAVRIAEGLIPLLGDKDQEERNRAYNVLVSLGEPAVLPLIAALKSPNLLMSVWCANALTEIKDIRAIMPLLELLAETREQLEARFKNLIQQDKEIQQQTISIRQSLETEEIDLWEGLGNSLKTLWDFSSKPKVQEDADFNTLDGIAEYLTELLLTFGDEAVPELLAALENQDRRVGRVAIDILGKLLEKGLSVVTLIKLVKPLIVALENENIQIRCGAAYNLGLLGEPVAVEPLIKLLDSDTNTALSAALALTMLDDGRITEPLLEFCKKHSIKVTILLAAGIYFGSRASIWVLPVLEWLQQNNLNPEREQIITDAIETVKTFNSGQGFKFVLSDAKAFTDCHMWVFCKSAEMPQNSELLKFVEAHGIQLALKPISDNPTLNAFVGWQVDLKNKDKEVRLLAEVDGYNQPSEYSDDKALQIELADFIDIVTRVAKEGSTKGKILQHLEQTKFILRVNVPNYYNGWETDEEGNRLLNIFLAYFTEIFDGVVLKRGKGIYLGDKLVIDFALN